MTLLERLESALESDAAATLQGIVTQLVTATPGAPSVMHRRARLLWLMCADALNANRPQASRNLRWRRFIATLAPFADETLSLPLMRLVDENTDLLHPMPSELPDFFTIAARAS